MKNIILKASCIISAIMFIILGCCASDNMSIPLGIIALLFGLYINFFARVNKDRWIFRREDYEK